MADSKGLKKVTDDRDELLSTLEEVLGRVEGLEGIDDLHGWFARAREVAERISYKAIRGE